MKNSYLILVTFCFFSFVQGMAQSASKHTLKLQIIPRASLASASSHYDISMFRQASVYGISSINIPEKSSNTLLRSAKDKPGTYWRTDGSVRNYSDKFKNTLNDVAKGKYFSVDAQNLGSTWIQQDAANAHKNNG